MKFLATLMPPKFYRYMYHKMVIMAVKFGNQEPYFSCVILMAMSTIFQLLFVVFGFGVLIHINIGDLIYPMFTNRMYQIIFSLLYGYVHYLLFYYKGKYIKIMEEFKNETPKQRTRGIIYLFIYLLVNFVVLCRIFLWFLTFDNPNYL